MYSIAATLGKVAPRLALLVPRLGSNHDGEVVATVHAIRRTLSSAGLDLHDLAVAISPQLPPPAPEPCPSSVAPDHFGEENWRDAVGWLLKNEKLLTGWELKFAKSLSRFPRLSPKQLAVLASILENAREAGHA